MKSKYPLLDACDPRTCTAGQIAWLQRTIHGIYRKHLLPYDITNSQLSILFVATKRSGISQVDMCKMLALEKSTLSRNLVRLTKDGYLAKSKVKGVAISEAGKAKLETVIPAWEAAKAEVGELMSDSGSKALEALLGSMRNR